MTSVPKNQKKWKEAHGRTVGIGEWTSGAKDRGGGTEEKNEW